MRFVGLNEIGREMVSQMSDLESNDKGKLVNGDLLDVFEESDWKERNFFVNEINLSGFYDHCASVSREACFIFFGKSIDIELIQGILDFKGRVLLVGAGNLNAKEIEFISRNGIRMIGLNKFVENIEEASDSVMEFASGKELVLGFDSSILDDFEFGGLSGRQAVYILSRMSLMNHLKGVLFSGVDEESLEVMTKLIIELF